MYYSKTMKKSHTRIFEGKAATKNKLVLESLIYGEKITAEIAEYIKKKEGGNKKHIQAEIGRKDGATDRLKEQGFIERNEQLKWFLTTKGLATALTLVQDKDMETVYETLKESMEKAHLREVFKNLAKMFSPEYVKEMEDFGFSLSFWKKVKEATAELINRGVDIEGMSSEEFYDLIIIKAFDPVVREITSRHMNRMIKKLSPKFKRLLSEGS